MSGREHADWSLVLARDGTVLAVAGGAPASWVGARLAGCADASDDVKEAARALLEQRSRFPPPAVTVPLGSQRQLHLSVVEALPVRRVRTDLPGLLRSSLAALERQAKSLDVALTIDTPHVLEPVSLDAEKVAWAVTALVGNALRYVRRGSHTMPGGTVTVRAIPSAATREIAIEIQDDGPGIPADRLQELSGDNGNGVRPGFGLSMVREVVAAHGGSLAILSDTGALHPGTTVRLTLPVVSPPPSAPSSDSI
jgi:signal transduction histidine kinase